MQKLAPAGVGVADERFCRPAPLDTVPDVLPDWPAGTVTILATGGEAPHAIPVSAAIRAAPRHVLIALASGRRSLTRLRADPRIALTIVARDAAVTAHGHARVVDEALAEGVVAVEIEVHEVQDHDRPTFAIEAGVQWRWTDPEAARRDADVHAALARLAASRGSARE
jgi:Pyridoxamine 5'-phosphate oxidase